MKSSITKIVLGLFSICLITGCQSGPPEYRGPATWAPNVSNCEECHQAQPAYQTQQQGYYHTQPQYHANTQQRTYQTPPSYDNRPQQNSYNYTPQPMVSAAPTWYQPEMRQDRECKPCEEYHWAWVDGPAHNHDSHEYKSGCDACRGRYTATYSGY